MVSYANVIMPIHNQNIFQFLKFYLDGGGKRKHYEFSSQGIVSVLFLTFSWALGVL